MFETNTLPHAYDAVAPDGSEVRQLLALRGGSMVHCALPAGATSRAVEHRTVEELWYVLSGSGEVWRKHVDHERVVAVVPGTALTIPLGMRFQFRSAGPEPLALIIVTMPPWPGAAEAARVDDHWPTASRQPVVQPFRNSSRPASSAWSLMMRGTLCWPPSWPRVFIHAAKVPGGARRTSGGAMPTPPDLCAR